MKASEKEAEHKVRPKRAIGSTQLVRQLQQLRLVFKVTWHLRENP